MPTPEFLLTPITEDIFQARLPLPFALNHVNCYLLRGDAGWTIVDTGLNIPAAQAAWRQIFNQLELGPGNVQQIVLTHAHPDHYGLAGWLQNRCAAPVRLSAVEWRFARQVWQQQDLPDNFADVFELAGAPGEVRQTIEAGNAKIRQVTQPHPQHVEILAAGATLQLGNRQFETILAPGHADGQLMFYDAADRLLLCADHVLQEISPNIGLWSLGEAAPLERYLASLRELANLKVRLALPGHHSLITGWGERLAQLQAHHAERLAQMRAAVTPAGATAYQVCRLAFSTKELSMHEIRFALAETLAHLEYLVSAGQLCRRDNSAGEWVYTPN